MPAGVLVGIVTLKLFAVVWLTADDPIFVGDAKDPLASDNCAVNWFPERKLQLVMNTLVNENVAPAQYVVAACVGEFIPIELIVMLPEEFNGLTRPDPGLLLVILMRYPLPPGVLTGMVVEMLNVPLPPADVNDPMGVGEPKFPKLSESSAVKTLDDGVLGKGQFELTVNGTVSEAPWQKVVPANEGALIPIAFTVSVVGL